VSSVKLTIHHDNVNDIAEDNDQFGLGMELD